MVEARTCSFCGEKIEPGTGRMHIKKDGKTFHFCSTKCFHNLVELKRVPRKMKWTKYHIKE